ncbi:IS6 family transposase [Neotabrizicola shimadae]|jgi:IS6 family transposase|uniref:IS6 family transposase n=1 Tax=Neotabrizicola shimadae TaxID=2807096 RepID=A0A8G1EF61_9RHOB|nr:IS6 family transposase [Neotabrizicola shimadae]QYZ72208.1 IS6 family transposase [Neotabrizicola shimadae]
MARRDPFRGHRFPKDVILLAVRWYCRYPLSYRDVRDMLAERGIMVDAASIYRWVRKFGPEIRKRALSRHRSWRGLTWHVDETYIRVNGRWCYLWRAVDQFGQLIDFRLTARRDAKAARAFLRQARETVRLYQPLTIITDKAPTYAKVIAEINDRLGPEDAIRHLTRKHLNNRIESDHAALKRLLRPMRGFRDLASAKATLKGIETFRAIRKAEFEAATKGVANEIAFTADLFQDAA